MEDLDLNLKHKGPLVSHLNVRSLWNKIDLVRTTFENLYIDVISFSETWLNEDMSDEYVDLKNYNISRNDRKWKEVGAKSIKKGGGVCMYVRNELQTNIGHIPTQGCQVSRFSRDNLDF